MPRLDYIRFARRSDIDIIIGKIRPEDLKELRDLNLDPKSDMSLGYANSKHKYTIVIDGEPCTMAGVYDTTPATIWFYGGADWTKPNKLRRIYKMQKKIFGALLKRYVVLTNTIDADYKQSINWCKHLGGIIVDKMIPTSNGHYCVPVVFYDKEGIIKWAQHNNNIKI